MISDPINVIVHGGIQIKGDGNLDIVSKVVQHNKVVNVNPRKPTIERNKRNNSLNNDPPKLL